MILRFPENFSTWVLSIGTAVTIYIYTATFKGITQPTIWQLQPGIDKLKVEADILQAEEIESRKPVPKDARLDGLAQKISLAMEKEKLYQEPELTLQNLAQKMQCPSYQVSQAINEGMNKSFYDLVNGYRVEEAKRLLLDSRNRNYTILSVGFEAGFNSKTTFNTVFKKFTGFTPTEFRNRQGTAVLAE
jgi:AraC-like DNA-binding protein